MKTKTYRMIATVEAARIVSSDIKGVFTLDTGTKKEPELFRPSADLLAAGLKVGDYLISNGTAFIPKAVMEEKYELVKLSKPAPAPKADS